MKKFKNAGFTLFELLAVLAIMAIIAGIAVPRVMQTITNARIEAIESELNMIANSVQRYAVEKELGSCIGGMFVINPTNAMVQGATAAGDVIDLNDLTTAPTSGADVDYLTVETANGTTVAPADGNAFGLIDYVEGGIPNYVTVQVYQNTDGDGEILVSYGLASDDFDHTTLTVNQKGGIEADELTPGVITRTFELDGGSGHKHTTEFDGYVAP